MATFVRILSDNLERPALDQTKLPGRYDFTRKELVEILVVDSVEQPSGN